MRATVGARELKTRLGAYLRKVRGGATLVVTDRGEPIAELRPLPSEGGAGAQLAALEALGVITRAVRPKLPPFRPLVSTGRSASAAVLADREDRF